jgi:hypothetical protein
MKTEVKDAGDLRRYRTEIPNIVDDSDLSVYAFRLYVHLKRVAGETGVCWQGTRTLATACKMSVGKVSDAKAELAKAGFIFISPGEGDSSDKITIADLWRENMETFYHGCSPHEQGVQDVNGSVHHMNERKNPVKKELRKKSTPNGVDTLASEKDPVALCRRITNRSPNEQQRLKIIAQVKDLARWRETLEKFMLEGQPPQKVDWMLERYHGRGQPTANSPPETGWSPRMPTFEDMAVAENISVEEARKRYADTGITGAT